MTDVLELVAQGMNWDEIIKECHGSVSRRAIAEAIRLAGRVIVEVMASASDPPLCRLCAITVRQL